MKKIINTLLICLLLAVSTGCYTRKEAQEFNKTSFSNPELVGEINGKKLYRIEIARSGQQKGHNHFVYFLEDSPALTVNHVVTEGKASANRVEVFIDGKLVVTKDIEKP